jgi:hypothetical protein
MTGDWRDWRPVIWMVMIGIAVALLVSPVYIAAVFFGGAIGIGVRIRQRQRRIAAAAPVAKRARRRRQ